MLFTPRPKGLGKDRFLKLSDGEEVTGVFRGKIHTFRQHWIDKRGVECVGEGCTICKANDDKPKEKKNYPAFRFRINFISSKDDKWEARIFESGGEVYDTLTMLDKKFDLSKTAIEITKRTTPGGTRTHVMPRSDYPITKELKAKIDAVTLHPLSAEGAQE